MFYFFTMLNRDNVIDIDSFVDAMVDIVKRAREDGTSFKEAPFSTPVRRLDDVKAARQLDVRYDPEGSTNA